MKRVLLVLAICLGFSVVIVSCKEKKEDKIENHEDNHDDMAMHDAYKCPMDCEKGKTYEKEGECPVCKMDLRKSKDNHDSDDEHSEEHN